MDYINLAINFVSASADVENTSVALTFDATNFVWIIPLVILSVCFASCLIYQRKKAFSTWSILGANNSIKNAKHVKIQQFRHFSSNSRISKLTIIAISILLSLSAIGLFVGKNAFASEGSLQPDTDKITATVYEDGSVSFSTCNLTNISSEIYTLDQASVSVSAEARSVVALASSTFTINGFDGVVYKGKPDGQFREAFNVVPLSSGEVTQLSFALEGLNKDNLMSLVDKNVFSISLKPIKVYEVNFDVQGHGIAPASYLNIKEGDKIPAPTDPTETGWIFDGWYKEKDCINQWLFDADTVTENTTLYAKWTPRTDTPYTVEHYKQNLDDTWPAQPFETDHLTGTTGSEVTPETKNYEGFTPPQVEPVVIKADGLLVVKYYYVRNSYEVSFDENGHGIAPDKQTIKYEGLVERPENPTEAGYIFEDWYKEPECTNKWNFENDKIFGVTILYANWEIDQNTSYKVEHFKQKIDGSYSDIPDDVDELTGPTGSEVTPDTKNYTGFTAPEKQTVTISADGSTVVDYEYTRNSYTVTFDANGHGTSPQATDVKYEDKATQPEEPQAEGYIFSGWYKESECIHEWVFAEEQVTRDTTLWAKWTEKSGYSVKYDPDGGSDVSPLTNLRWTSDNLLPAKNPEKQGYEFIGWFYGNDKSIQATSATKYWEIASSAEEDEVTIYAKWNPKDDTPYTVRHFKQNIDGTYPQDPADVDSLSGTTGTEVTAETKTYYGFTSPQKLTVVISADGLTVVDYLYTRNSYTVSFDSNGHGSAPETETVKFEDFAIAPTSEPTETGYAFNGWYKEKACVNPWIFAEDRIVEDTTIYAKWTANTYTVSFDNKGHGIAPEPKDVTYDSAYGELPVLTDEGYILAGWYLDELFSEGSKVETDTVVKTAENHTLYAKWTAKSGTVTFVTNGHGGSTPDSKDVIFGQPYGDLPNLTEEGYTFGGWYLDQEFTPEKIVESTTIVKTAGDHYLYAKWTANTYTVFFDNSGHGGSTPASIQVTFDSAYGHLPVLSDANYKFCCWKDQNGSVANIDTIYKIASDSTLTATWTETAQMYYGYQDTANGKILYLAGCSTANAPTNCSSALAAQAATDCPWNDQRTNITSVIVETYIYPTSTAYWFTDLSSCSVFNITQLNTANVTNMQDMFSACSAVQNIDVSNWDTSKVESMKRMFGKCQKLLKLDLSNWNTAKVKDMSNMFQLCTNLTDIDLDGFNTSSVTNMSYMFSACWNLGVLNISTFDTSKVTDMQYMFNSCWKMQTICASELFNTSKVTDDNSMFFDCEKLVGGNGTKYNKDHVNKEYAVIDGLNGKPGYFTKQTINYQVCIWGIGQDKCGVDGSDTANLTFGPATGETNACLDVDGHHEHCIHNDSWDTIIKNCNEGHADWYRGCMENGCTISVPIILNFNIGTNPAGKEPCSILYPTSKRGHLLSKYVMWNASYNSYDCESANWATSRIRATLNGKTGNESIYAGEDCLDSSNCLLSCFPVNLRDAIKPKYYQVPTTWSIEDPCSIETSVFVSDKLWVMSAEEVYGQTDLPTYIKEFEKAQYTKKQNEGTTWNSNSKNKAYVWNTSTWDWWPESWWLRSPFRYYQHLAGSVGITGFWGCYDVNFTGFGISPCFCL